jgi:hypothetical protein
MHTAPTHLHSVFPLLRDRVETHYRIPVLIIDVPDPFAGDLDGAEIHLDFASADDLQVFTLAHLFGHTIQWSLSSHFWTLGGQAPGTYSEGDRTSRPATAPTWRTSTARARSGRRDVLAGGDACAYASPHPGVHAHRAKFRWDGVVI